MDQAQQLTMAQTSPIPRQHEIAVYDAWGSATEDAGLRQPLTSAKSHRDYESQRAEFTISQSQLDLSDAVEEFLQVNPVSDFDVHNCTIEDVADQARLAQAEYQRRVSNNKILSFLDQRGPIVAKNIQPWMELLPEDYGLRSVRGALGLIFNALIRTAENREKIFSFILNVPSIIDHAKQTQRTLPRDQRLRDAHDELSQAMIQGLTDILRFVLPKQKRSVLKTMRLSREGGMRRMNGSLTAESTSDHIDRIVKSVDDSKAKFDAVAQVAHLKVAAKANATGDRTLREAQATRQHLHSGFSDIQDRIREMQRGIRDDMLKKSSGSESKADFYIQTFIYHISQGAELGNLLQPNPATAAAAVMPSPSVSLRALSGPTISIAQLLSLIQVPEGVSEADLVTATRRSHSFSASQLCRVNWLLKDQRFQHWLLMPQTSHLLVDGHCGEHGGGSISPMSVFSSILSTTLPKFQSTLPHIVLAFLCGLHLDERDPISGPEGMLRSLISQLIAGCSTLRGGSQPHIPAETGLADALGAQDIGALCHVLSSLISQLPNGMRIYVILDDIARCETSLRGWKYDMNYIVEQLLRLAPDYSQQQLQQQQGPMLKLIMTNTNKSSEVYRLLPPESCISIRADHHDDSDLWSEQLYLESLIQALPDTQLALEQAGSGQDELSAMFGGMRVNTLRESPEEEELARVLAVRTRSSGT